MENHRPRHNTHTISHANTPLNECTQGYRTIIIIKQSRVRTGRICESVREGFNDDDEDDGGVRLLEATFPQQKN